MLCSYSLETKTTFPFFLLSQNNSIYRTALMNELNNVGNTITSLKQNDCDPAWGQKLWQQQHQSMMETKTLIEIVIKVYSSQPSNLSDTLNDLTNYFLGQSQIAILDKSVYKIIFKNSFIFLLFIISVYEEIGRVYFSLA